MIEQQQPRRRWPLWLGLGAAVVVFLGLVPVLAMRVTGDSEGGLDLPVKPADFVGSDVSAADTGARQLAPARAGLAGPHFTIGFTSLEITTTSGIDYRAADGYEFLRLSPATATMATAPGEDVKAEVVADGRDHPVDPEKVTQGGLTVSVRKGHPAVLRVTDEGRTQSLDLRTGTRGDDAIPGYYPRVALSWKDDGYSGSGTTSSGGCRRQTTLTMSFTPDEATVQPWSPDLGWAKPARAWLPVPYSAIVAPVSVPDYDSPYDMPPVCADELNFTWDLGASVAVLTAGGETAPARILQGDNDGILVFDVPLSTQTATLLVHPAGTYDPGDGHPRPVEWTEPPPTGRTAMTRDS